MRHFRQVAALAAFGSLIACSGDQPTGTHAPPFNPRITSTPQWAGGVVEVTASLFTGAEPLPVLTAGTQTLVVRRVGDSTVAARMPALGGTYSLQVTEGVASTNLGPISLAGFREELVGPIMSGQVTRVNPDSAGAPIVFSSGDSGGVLVNLSTNTIVGTVPESVTSPDCSMSPGSSYRGAGYYTLQGETGGTCGPIHSWQVYPTLVRQDSSPIFAGQQWYVIAEVGPKRWFSSWNNHSHVYDCTGASCTDLMFGDPSGPNAVTIAPGDGKFTWTAQDLHGAVLNVNGFDTAFALPANTSMSGAVFSPGGDTLFFHGMLSNGGSSTQHLGAVRVSDGAVVHDLSVDSIGFGRSASSTGSVALDPGHPWLYAVVTLPGVPGNTLNRPALVVLDRSTWSVIGVAMAPALSAEAYNDWIFNSTSIVPDPANHHVYVVATDYLYDVHQHHGAIVVFDTP